MSTDSELTRLKALAHPVRLGILRQLAESPEVCACDLGDAFSVSQPTISEHLRVLREAGLVQTRRDGTKICYSTDAEGVREALAGIERLLPLANVPA
jgi:DNA-binding transcriptional ArsR family regulator